MLKSPLVPLHCALTRPYGASTRWQFFSSGQLPQRLAQKLIPIFHISSVDFAKLATKLCYRPNEVIGTDIDDSVLQSGRHRRLAENLEAEFDHASDVPIIRERKTKTLNS
jgi:hypothetical protein